MHSVFLLLGSNLGDKEKILLQAMLEIGRRVGELVKQSSFYKTEPWGFVATETFVNVVIEVTTEKTANQVLQIVLNIEEALGRVRSEFVGYQSRTIDIDLLFFDDEVINSKSLIIPHQRIHERRFALMPLSEIAPELMHPVFCKSIAELLLSCTDTQKVEKIKPPETEKSKLI